MYIHYVYTLYIDKMEYLSGERSQCFEKWFRDHGRSTLLVTATEEQQSL